MDEAEDDQKAAELVMCFDESKSCLLLPAYRNHDAIAVIHCLLRAQGKNEALIRTRAQSMEPAGYSVINNGYLQSVFFFSLLLMRESETGVMPR